MKSYLFGAACACSVALLASTAVNAAIVYEVDRAVGDGTITGFIETDGTLGILSSANITSWNLTLTAPNLLGSPSVIDSSTGLASIDGTATTATATQLLFDFSASGNTFFLLQDPPTTGNYWCLEIQGCVGPGGEIIGRTSTGGPAQIVDQSGSVVFAQVIPIPAALWLFASALGLLGWLKRRAV